MRHTPGPWGISDTFRIFGPNRRHPQSTELGVEMLTNTTVAWAACPNHDEQRANAQLIAAAPELLEASHHALLLLSGLSTDGEITMTSEGKDRILAELKAAIARAEGNHAG